MKQTPDVSEEQLLEQSWPRILALGAEGVATVEIKSLEHSIYLRLNSWIGSVLKYLTLYGVTNE